MLCVASMVIVGVATAGAAALGLTALTGLVTFVAFVVDAGEILALLAAALTGGPITMTAEGTLVEEVIKGALLWVPVARAWKAALMSMTVTVRLAMALAFATTTAAFKA
jgi:hypothetical protein